MSPDSRDEIAEAVRYGRMTPEEAEAKLKELGLPPLAPQPDPADFNPMGEVWWTLPMAIAWIVWRSHAAVLDAYDPYRLQCSYWLFREWTIGFDGPVHPGYFLEHGKSATLSFVGFSESYDRAHGTLPGDGTSVSEAKRQLWNALQSNAMQATGIDSQSGSLGPIPDHDWRDLRDIEENDRDVVRFRELNGFSRRGYDNVQVRRQNVMALWKPDRSEENVLATHSTVTPDGAGYMPLFCAAQWIATRGGTFDFHPLNLDVWKGAYTDLLAQIASGGVTTIGVRSGAREKLEGHVFAGIRVSHPYQDTEFDMLLGDELYLMSFPYIDEQHWDREFDDSLQDRSGRKWSKLMVLKSDVAHVWPFSTPKPVALRSGAPGRPTSMQLVLIEFDARWKRGEVEKTAGGEADALAAWLGRAHPEAPRLKPKSIRNRIGPEHMRRLNAARK